MVKDKLKSWKEKFAELIKLKKSDREIFDEMNKDKKRFNSLSEVRRVKHQIKEKYE